MLKVKIFGAANYAALEYQINEFLYKLQPVVSYNAATNEITVPGLKFFYASDPDGVSCMVSYWEKSEVLETSLGPNS